VRRALAIVREHPRHLVLGALVAGLLGAPASELAVLPAAAALAVLASGPRVAVLATAALVAGALIADARLRALDAGELSTATGRPIEARAVVLEPIRERPVGPAAARIRLLDGLGAGEQAVLRIRTSAYGAAERDTAGAAATSRGVAAAASGGGADAPGASGGEGVWPEVGDIVHVRGRVEPLGRFDAYQRRRNAHAAIAGAAVIGTGTRRGGAAGVLDGARRRAEAGLASRLEPPEAALLRGMVLGEDEQLTEKVRDEFQRSGLAHILAVSGQNVMLLAVLVLAACALTGVPLRARLLLAAAVIVAYVPLAGGGPSIQRAGVMGVAGLVAALAGRPARRWYALLLAAAATLALNPRAAGEPGWQLSFAAVAALLLGTKPLRDALARSMPEPVAEAAAITIAATVGTAPLMALHFEQVSLASLPANLLAAPAIAPIMWLGVLAAAAAQIAAPLAAPFSALTAPLLVYVQNVAHATAATPLSVVEIHAPPAAIVAGWVAALAAIALGVRYRRRLRALAPKTRSVRRLVTALAAAATALLVLAGGIDGRGAGAAAPGPSELVVSFLDIGQGDATLIQLGAISVLVDTGPPDGPILERLEESGIKRLDALLITHAEADHEGAAPAVIRRYAPRLVVDGGAGWPTAVQRLLPTALAAARGRQMTPRAGQTITVGSLRFKVLWPPPPRPGERLTGNPNDRAVVARLTAHGFSMLLAADAESNVTAPLDLEPVDVLKVAHHGSADPGLPALLERLKPRIAAIEVGRRNTFGHPTPSTLAALSRAVPTVVRTDRDGTIRLHVLRGRMWIRR
jgi:competence protein ComEC